jgi:hypothetical protein
LIIEDITFSPSNEGEVSTYQFRIIAPDTIDADSNIIVWFPEQFDPSINLNIDSVVQCWTSEPEYLGNLINCSIEPSRRIRILGFKEINSNLTFDLFLSGVINPNSVKLGKFRFAIQDKEGKTIYYTTKSGNLTVG